MTCYLKPFLCAAWLRRRLKMSDENVTLEFLGRQQRRLLDEMTNFRDEMSMFRNDISVLSAMAVRQDHATKKLIEQMHRVNERLAAIEGANERVNERLAAIEGANERVNERLAAIEGTNERVIAAINGVSEHLGAINSRLAALEGKGGRS
jgi:chromosome segregation ATPase